ncbi:M20 family metallopeptidase [Deinococcus roseus]|uniref:Acetylornithine deacetylase n=1 Tax=Deinococcus roseus TaxID=392414 RepID=A0ABQ2DC97_9DEIO|nr:M20/M25/M40 family metallo-hydrolase [Deinococcus roseus]GGJ53225.1 acetylornithine deacetylase [Deinococcus roseus]
MFEGLSFLQELLKTRSYTGSEGPIGQRVVQEMKLLGFDHAYLDESGNAIGVVRGKACGEALLLISHLDHVHEGDVDLWEHPPYAAVLEKNVLHGRGTVDIKGPLSAQIYALGGLLQRGERPAKDVVLAAFVEEETGGKGIAEFLSRMPFTLPDGEVLKLTGAVVGEPSSNQVMLGHRGVAHVTLVFKGAAHHASFGLHDQNPMFELAEFLGRLRQYDLPVHPIVGEHTLTPTQISCDSGSENVTSNTVSLVLDWRSTSTPEEMRQILKTLTAGLKVEYQVFELWTLKNTPGFHIEADHPLVQNLQQHVKSIHDGFGIWNFATDGRYTHAHNIPTVGFGPGNPRLAHTVHEHIHLEELQQHVEVLQKFLLDLQ